VVSQVRVRRQKFKLASPSNYQRLEEKKVSSLEEFRQSWGILFEGPVRKKVRTKLADFLGVPGVQFPVITRLRKIIRG